MNFDLGGEMDFSKFIIGHECVCEERVVDDAIDVTFSVDANFIAPLGIMLTSMLMNNSNSMLHMYLFCDSLKSDDLTKLRSLIKNHKNACMDIFFIDSDLIKDEVGKSTPVATFYRIIMAKVLYPKVARIFYTDVDALCLSSLEILETLSFDCAVFMAVEDTMKGKAIREHKREIGIPDNAKYFNAGVMYIDLVRWNELKISERAFELLQDKCKQGEHFAFYDQDVLNIVAYDDWKELPVTYNLMISELRERFRGKLPEDTLILHFAGPYKPWDLWLPEGDDLDQYCIERKLFDEYRNKSLWPDFKGQPLRATEMRLLSRYMLMNKHFIKACYWQYRYLREKISMMGVSDWISRS